MEKVRINNITKLSSFLRICTKYFLLFTTISQQKFEIYKKFYEIIFRFLRIPHKIFPRDFVRRNLVMRSCSLRSVEGPLLPATSLDPSPPCPANRFTTSSASLAVVSTEGKGLVRDPLPLFSYAQWVKVRYRRGDFGTLSGGVWERSMGTGAVRGKGIKIW